MILFHEGLPRSGKSYAACKDHVIPALSKGRRVIAYIEGLNHEAIAALAGISVERCKELLIPIAREEVYLIWSRDYKDALVVIDEAQNFWPDERKPLNDEITKFITEHGHHGADILLMGQVLNDVHKLWRGRIARNYYFNKRDALGKPNQYRVSIQRSVRTARGVKFEETSNETHDYEEKYFGTYASHVGEVENTDTLHDARAVVWNHPVIKKWMPRLIVVVVAAVIYLFYLFKGGGLANSVTHEDKRPSSNVVAAKPGAAPAQQSAPAAAPAPKAAEAPESDDYVKVLTAKAKPRLVSVLRYRGAVDGSIQWLDNAKGDVIETLSFSSLGGLGWSVFVDTTGSMAILRRGPAQYVVTASGVVKGQALR